MDLIIALEKKDTDSSVKNVIELFEFFFKKSSSLQFLTLYKIKFLCCQKNCYMVD